MSVRTLQIVGLIGFAIVGLILMPRLRRASRAQAMIALLSVHAARVIVLVAIPAQQAGYPLSNLALGEMLAGDLLGAALAAAAIVALLRRSPVGIALSWVVLIETVIDLVAVVHSRIAEPISVTPPGPLLFVMTVHAPLILVTLPLMAWQLVSRRTEPLTTNRRESPGAADSLQAAQ